jgi:hypothetical protein
MGQIALTCLPHGGWIVGPLCQVDYLICSDIARRRSVGAVA